MHKTIASRLLLSSFLLLLSSCSSSTPIPTLTPSRIPTPIATPVPTSTPTATPTPIPLPERAKYTLNATVNYDAHTVAVDETILYPNHTGQQLNSLLIAIVPNLWPGAFTLHSISLDGAPLSTYLVDGQRLDVTLPSMFMPGTVMTINIQYSLALPFAEQEDPNVSRPRIFGYTNRQINLTNWYPFVVPFINGEWILHEPWFYGEHLVYDAADYEVNLKFTDPATAPVVAASGFPEPQGDFTRYTLTEGRAFAISASREFQVSSLEVGGVTVSSYHFPLEQTQGRGALQASAQALEIFGQAYGPYPHKTLSIVEGDFNDGMEFSAFYFHSRGVYNLYTDSLDNLVVAIAVHETAHQWWFEQVANDQALQPWLDEALAFYSERLFYETVSPDSVRQWWLPYRVEFYQPKGFIDTTIYDGGGFRPYTDAVYLRGGYFIHDLRERIGDEAFFAFLRDYLAQGRGKIVKADDFFRILNEHTSTDYSDIVRKYFQNVY